MPDYATANLLRLSILIVIIVIKSMGLNLSWAILGHPEFMLRKLLSLSEVVSVTHSDWNQIVTDRMRGKMVVRFNSTLNTQSCETSASP